MTKYDRQTLLALSQNARIDLNRFSDQAFGNNLLRPQKPSAGILVEHAANWSRNVSNFSHQSETVPADVEPSPQFPARQPHNPPQEVGAQYDAGFARFLKEHTSPKHQRVTAGGRIVPMSLPPKWNLSAIRAAPNASGSLAQPVSRSENKNRSQDCSIQEVITNTHATSTITPLPRETVVGNQDLPFVCGHAPPPQLSNLPSFQSTTSSSSTLSLSNSSLATNHPNQLMSEPQSQGYFPMAQQEYATCGLESDPAAWLPNSFQGLALQDATAATVPHSVHPFAVPSTASELSSGNGINRAGPTLLDQFQQCYDTTLGVTSQWPQVVKPPMPAFNQQYIAPQAQEALYQKSLDDAKRHHASLSTQLSRLDRYMALNSWNIDANVKRALVEQRMGLVRELDTLRLYKEHLQFLFGKVKVSVPVPLCANGPGAGEQTLLGPGSVVPGMNFGGPTFSMAPQIRTTQQPFPVSDQPLPTALWQNVENPTHYRSDARTGNIPTLQHASGDQSLSEHQQVREPTPAGEVTKRRACGKVSEAVSASAEPETPTKSAPSEIRRLYRQIEDATRQGKSIEGLVKELSIVTTRLAQGIKEPNQSFHVPSVALETRVPNASARIQAVPAATGDPNGAVRYPVHLSKRLWQSEEYPPSFNNRRRIAPTYPKEDDDRRSCASYLSTTDSWVTTQEGEKRWLDRELRNCAPSEERNWQSWKNDPARLRTESAESKVSSLRNAAVPSIPVEPTTVSPAVVTDFSGAPVWQGSKTPYPPLLTQCFSGDRSPALQKTTALAVPQNVNAHAFLPHLDGATDTPPGSSTAPSDRNGGKIGASEQKKKRWRMPKKSVKPMAPVAREK